MPPGLPPSNALIRLPACLLVLLAFATSAAAAPRSDGERGIAEYRKGNLIEGMRLLENAAAGGYLPAQTTLAFILDAAEQDDRALHWYRQAASARDAAGLYGLGGMYAKGEGTPRDSQRAAELIGEAASLGHVEAMRVYAHALEHGLMGLDARSDEALGWYRRAADRGDARSMNRLAEAHGNGELGLAVDKQRARDWRERSQANE